MFVWRCLCRGYHSWLPINSTIKYQLPYLPYITCLTVSLTVRHLVAGGPGGNNRDTGVSLGHISNIITTIITG